MAQRVHESPRPFSDGHPPNPKEIHYVQNSHRRCGVGDCRHYRGLARGSRHRRSQEGEVLCDAGSGFAWFVRGDLLDPPSLISQLLYETAVVARPTTAVLFLVAAMLFAATPAVAADPPEVATPPISGNIEVGLSEEASRFTQ